MAGELEFKLRAVNQVCLVVRDVDAAMASYWRDLGVGPWRVLVRQASNTKLITCRGKPAPEARWIVAIAEAGSVALELIQPLEGDTIFREFLARSGEGVQHLGYAVEDIHRAVEEMQAAGFQVTLGGFGIGPRGDGGFAFFDTEEKLGVSYELYQMPAERYPPDRFFPAQP